MKVLVATKYWLNLGLLNQIYIQQIQYLILHPSLYIIPT